ncbi:MAG TPA: galactokinase [Chthoniobacteraceae bacterium]|nr:galactokinase [Chthoniobacteraceae bacterium]
MNVASAYAPGRVELLGNHTDYNGGVVLAAAIDRGLTVAGSARDDDRIVLTSESLQRRLEVSLRELQPQVEERWANYGLGVVRELIDAGFPVRGFEAAVRGELPPGAGLSSSAAFEVATALFLLKLHGWTLDPLALAQLCQRAENEFVGVRSGLLDQATSVFGKADHVVYLDCRSLEVRTIPFPPGLALLIADPGKKHALVHGEYNARRRECFAAAEALGVPGLRDVSAAEFGKVGDRLEPLLRRRAAHIIGENDRVWRAADALAAGDAATFGSLMNASHESSRTNFENSTPELDRLVGIARTLPGALGSRLTGGGFGGATVTLAHAAEASSIATELQAQFARATGETAKVFVCEIADGAA